MSAGQASDKKTENHSGAKPLSIILIEPSKNPGYTGKTVRFFKDDAAVQRFVQTHPLLKLRNPQKDDDMPVEVLAAWRSFDPAAYVVNDDGEYVLPLGPAAEEHAAPVVHEPTPVAEEPPVPPWRIATEDDTQEELDPADIEEDPYDIGAELAALGPQPEEPPPVEEYQPPPSTKSDLERFANTLKMAFLATTQGERDNALAGVRNMAAKSPDLVHRTADAVELFMDGHPVHWKESNAAAWDISNRLRRALNQYHEREKWFERKIDTLKRMAEGRHKYKNPEAAKKNHEVTAKNLDRARRVVWHMRMMIQNMLRNGIPTTRAELDDLCAKASLSHAKEFRGWWEQVWTEIEAAPKHVPPTVTLLRLRNAQLIVERDKAQSESRERQRRIDELERQFQPETVH